MVEATAPDEIGDRFMTKDDFLQLRERNAHQALNREGCQRLERFIDDLAGSTADKVGRGLVSMQDRTTFNDMTTEALTDLRVVHDIW